MPHVTSVPHPSCRLPWGFSWLLRSETPRDTVGAPRGNPDVSRIKAPWGNSATEGSPLPPHYSSHRCPAAFRKVTPGDPAVALGTGWWPALSHSLCAHPSPPPSYIPGWHLLINRGSAGSAFPSSRLRQMAGRGGANLHLMNKYLLIPYDRPGPLLSGRNTEANKTDAVLSYGAHVEKKKRRLIMKLMICKQTFNLTRDVR